VHFFAPRKVVSFNSPQVTAKIRIMALDLLAGSNWRNPALESETGERYDMQRMAL